MVFAKTSKAAARLSESVRERSLEKEYLCIVDRKSRTGKRSFRELPFEKSD